MKLQDHEVVCDKCHGNTITDKNGDISILCDRCGGTGKLDWVEKAMVGANKINSSVYLVNTMPNPSCITFHDKNQDEMIKIADDGFYVKGKKISDDKKLYHAFVDFLKGAGTYK